MATRALKLTETHIGKKMVMALSGLVLFGFVITHMLGNLQAFISPDKLNQYSHTLHQTPLLLWGARSVLLLAVFAHIVTAVQLTMANKKARPVRYAKKQDVATSYAAKIMPIGGMLLLFYILYHLAHLTVGVTAGLGYQHLPTSTTGVPDVYSNIVNSFKVPWLTAIYLVAQVFLGLHLYHGSWSMFQSLGLTHERYNRTLRSAASAFAIAVAVGFAAVPIAVLTGFLK
jgi:succinate dehydrogenase / fumarate reductase, cytochrome b subunit